MKVLVRFRVDKRQMEKANKVTEQLGTSTPEMIRIFLAEIARTGKVPVSFASPNIYGRGRSPWADSPAP